MQGLYRHVSQSRRDYSMLVSRWQVLRPEPWRGIARYIPIFAGTMLLGFSPVACTTVRPIQVTNQVSLDGSAPEFISTAVRTDATVTTYQPGQARGSPPQEESLLFQGSELTLQELIQAVLLRNPTLAEMVAAWQAASARAIQVASYEDPMFRVSVGPGSIGSDTVDFAYRLELSQKIPFPGKLSLRGEQASREADASAQDYLDTRWQLIEATSLAYYEYYLVHRALEVNQENLKLLQEARRTAEARVRTGLAPQQDLLQLDVELGKQQERQLMLERMLTVTKARINTLLHRPPDESLPPPVAKLPVPQRLPQLENLYTQALQNRPDLQAIRQRLESERLSLALADREYYPDFELMAAYDAFWQEKPLRTLVGVGMNLPVQLTRRRAAIAENAARLAQRQAQLDRLTDQIHLQVRENYTRLLESRNILDLYEKKLIPAAQANIREATTAYTTGRIPLLSLLEAQRNLVQLRDRYYEVLADYYRALASLERAVAAWLNQDEHEGLEAN